MSNGTGSKYRSRTMSDCIIAFSISYERENLLARGLGLEHLRELLLLLARPILRQGASLAYGGNWDDKEDNFTFDLLRLISAEQEENNFGGLDSKLQIGKLYNHSSWPYYLKIKPGTEAKWINCCRIVRVTQQDAGLADADIVPDSEANNKTVRARFNTAVALSVMRRLVMSGMTISIPDVLQVENVPKAVARILLGGKVDSYSGFAPGIFEEALVTLKEKRPLYIMGGFGGASEVLAKAMLMEGNDRPPEFTLDWHKRRNKPLAELLEGAKGFVLPTGVSSTVELLDSLFGMVQTARGNLAGILNTGLSEKETRELLTTRNTVTAVQLVRAGLVNQNKLPPLPA